MTKNKSKAKQALLCYTQSPQRYFKKKTCWLKVHKDISKKNMLVAPQLLAEVGMHLTNSSPQMISRVKKIFHFCFRSIPVNVSPKPEISQKQCPSVNQNYQISVQIGIPKFGLALLPPQEQQKYRIISSSDHMKYRILPNSCDMS